MSRRQTGEVHDSSCNHEAVTYSLLGECMNHKTIKYVFSTITIYALGAGQMSIRNMFSGDMSAG